MSLNPGTRLGSYEIVGPLGAGGMGEVYRATDSHLKRSVAIKVLPASMAADADRLMRFQREAEVLAALNHPNIAAIYGLEKFQEKTSGVFSEGAVTEKTPDVFSCALVMELVEGQDLSELIASSPGLKTRPPSGIPLADALAIAKQIADALEAAHEQGIVHRDLKPQNIKVRVDGTVKVLDFGLAKAMDRTLDSGPGTLDPKNSPTMTARATQMGMILGTAAYMSPEQAKGRAVDKRADIWAFGVVLHEMLTGQRCFKGDDISETLAAVLRDTPDFAALPAATPLRLRRLLERCLERDIRMRLRDIGEARVEIAKIESGAPELGMSAVGSAPAVEMSSKQSRRWLAAGVALGAVAAVVVMSTARWANPAAPPASDAVTQVSMALPDGDEVGGVHLSPLDIAADGSRVVYVGLRGGKTQVFVRALGERTAKALDGTDGAAMPFFSPDGQWIAFFAGGKLKKVSVGGAAVQDIVDAPQPRGGDWARDGYIYFAPSGLGGIWRAPEGGGAATEVTSRDAAIGEISHRWPHVVDGSNTLLFSSWIGPGNDEQDIAIQTIGEKTHHVLAKGGNAPRYDASNGLLLYFRLGELFAVPWRPGQADIGNAVPVALSQQIRSIGVNEGSGGFSMSEGGTLAYIAGERSRNAMRLVWVDRAGKVEIARVPERDYENVTISPDGTRAIVQIRDGITALWMYDLARGTLTPIGSSPGSSQAPVWTSDGARVIYRGTRAGFRNIFWRSADGSGAEERLVTKPDVTQSPTSASPDGHWLVFSENSAQEFDGVGIWKLRLDGDHTPTRVFQTPGGESDGQISPDGKWIAYMVPVASRQEIYVSPFPGPGPRRAVSTDGGTEPLWSRDGRELFYQNGTKLMSAAVTTGAVFSASAPRLIHEGRFRRASNGNTSWSTTRDGARFLRIQPVEPEQPVTRIDLVLNFFTELKQAVGRKR